MAQVYLLRKTLSYQRQHLTHTKTNPSKVAIGERRKPTPNGQPVAEAEKYLKPGISLQQLETFAKEMTDNEAAEQLNTARRILFKTIHEQAQKQA